jgi:prolyl-tRNA synthetase
MFLSALQPKELWEKSGRWSKLTGDMYQFKDSSDREVGLAMTHEEPMIDLLAQQPLSYQDFPINVYQFQDKFRDEPRAKSGLLRAREFIMKDMYSNHTTEEGFKQFYEEAKIAYGKIYKRLGIPAVPTLASGGIFTDDFSHEFQSPCEIGEDTIYVCPENDYAVNKEVVDRLEMTCPTHKVALVEQRGVEVGNIFPLGVKFSDSMDVKFTDEDGTQKPFWSGCYGIGLGRSMGVAIEQNHDDKGMIWPEEIAPYAIHLIDLTKTPEEKEQAAAFYQQLLDARVEVLYDDRELPAGVKFADADLIGIPTRVVVSAKTLADQQVETKERNATKATFVPVSEFLARYGSGR